MLEKVEVGGLLSTREDHFTYVALQNCPKDTASAYGSSNASGVQHARSTDPHDATNSKKKASSSSSSGGIFAGISDFFTQLGNSNHQDKDNSHAVTPVTSAGSALSSSEEVPTEIYDDEPATLNPQWGSVPDVMTLPLAGCEKRARSPPIAIDVAGKRSSSWQTEASPNTAGNGGCHGRRAGDPEDQGGEGSREEGRSEEADARAKIKEWRESCASKRVSFTVRGI